MDKRAEQRRLSASFLTAAAIYAPLMALAFWSASQEHFAAAGDRPMTALAFAQVAGGAAAPAEEAAPEAAAAEAQQEPPAEAPAPEPKSEPEPMPEPAPVAAPEPPQKRLNKPADKKSDAPKPTPKAEKPAAKPAEKKTADKPVQAAAPQPSAASASSSNAPTAGGAVVKADHGIATLVYGEANDPFLSEVKRLIEERLKYPRKARMMKITGRATVQFVVAGDGALSELKVFESAGSEILDKAAMRAVKAASASWSAPQRVVRLRLPVAFSLR